jgi:hypothetical protein
MSTLDSTATAAELQGTVSPTRLRREQRRRAEAFLAVAELQARADGVGRDAHEAGIELERQRQIVLKTTQAIDAHYRNVAETFGRERPHADTTRANWEGKKGSLPGPMRPWEGELTGRESRRHERRRLELREANLAAASVVAA